MGAKFSAPQLQRKKSLSSIGRSSQRSLFQKTKYKLRAIEKRIESQTNHDEIRNDLDLIENELLGVSETIKEKNKDKYEELVKLFAEVKSKLPDKSEAREARQEHEVSAEDVVVANDEEEKLQDVDLRNPIELYQRPASPLTKFGVQVMPIAPRVSQEMLKRNTVPHNEAAKVEFQEIRAMSGETKVFVHSTSSTRIEENGAVLEFSRVSVSERPFQVKTDLNQVDRARNNIDDLEEKLKYFHGTKGDEDYQYLHQKFVQNLAKLENIDSDDNPVIKQEKKILMERIQELLKILERISQPIVAAETKDVVQDPASLVGTAI